MTTKVAKQGGRVTAAALAELVEPKAEVQTEPEPTPKPEPQVEPKAEPEPKFWQDEEVIELVACLATEVANDGGQFTASDIEKLVGMGTWGTVVTVMKQNEGGAFLRESKFSRWTVAVNGVEPTASEAEGEQK